MGRGGGTFGTQQCVLTSSVSDTLFVVHPARNGTARRCHLTRSPSHQLLEPSRPSGFLQPNSLASIVSQIHAFYTFICIPFQRSPFRTLIIALPPAVIPNMSTGQNYRIHPQISIICVGRRKSVHKILEKGRDLQVCERGWPATFVRISSLSRISKNNGCYSPFGH